MHQSENSTKELEVNVNKGQLSPKQSQSLSMDQLHGAMNQGPQQAANVILMVNCMIIIAILLHNYYAYTTSQNLCTAKAIQG